MHPKREGEPIRPLREYVDRLLIEAFFDRLTGFARMEYTLIPGGVRRQGIPDPEEHVNRRVRDHLSGQFLVGVRAVPPDDLGERLEAETALRAHLRDLVRKRKENYDLLPDVLNFDEPMVGDGLAQSYFPERDRLRELVRQAPGEFM